MSIQTSEYPAFYSGYIKNVGENVFRELEDQLETFPAFIQNIPVSKASFAYAPEKWTIAEVIGHVLDTERVMAYRAMCFARDTAVTQPGFDENVFAANAQYKNHSLASLSEEFYLLRKSNLFLLRSFPDEVLQNNGIANGNKISVRALLYIMAGHLIHHQNILKERYLNG